MKIRNKEITDECTKCGQMLQCELFKQGHGIGMERSNITEMMKCQFKHEKEKRYGSDFETDCSDAHSNPQ